MLNRKTGLKRKTPLKSDPEKIKAWRNRVAKKLNPVSRDRKREMAEYKKTRENFLAKHPICPVTGQPVTQIHHSARRQGQWLNLQRYWIAVSSSAHRWVEDNAKEAENYGLMVRIRGHNVCQDHINHLMSLGIDLNEPLFYTEQDKYKEELLKLRESLGGIGYY